MELFKALSRDFGNPAGHRRLIGRAAVARHRTSRIPLDGTTCCWGRQSPDVALVAWQTGPLFRFRRQTCCRRRRAVTAAGDPALPQLLVFATYCIIHDCIGTVIPTARAATITKLHRNDDAAEHISASCILMEGHAFNAIQELTYLA